MKPLKRCWSTVSELHTVTPEIYYRPQSYDDVVSAVLEAEGKGLRIRAVGSGHTSTDLAICPGILLDMRYMQRVSRPDISQLKPTARAQHLALMDAGANIDTFNRQLDKLGLAFRSLGIIDHQTISGAIATGTHANVPTQPGFPGLVKSALLVASSGKKYRIEPLDGVTDPLLHNEPGTELIQDDDVFQSALLHLGTFGIVVSYLVEVEPPYWLMEVRTVERWSHVAGEIRNETLFRDYPTTVNKITANRRVFAMNIALNPHEVDGDHLCMVGRFFKLHEKPRRGLGDRIRSVLPSLVGRTKIPYHALMKQAEKNPEKTPVTLNKGLQMMHDRSYINKSYKVWNQGMEAMADMTYGSEFAFNGIDAGWLDAVDAFFDKVKDLTAQNIYVPNTLMLRYTQGSPAWLAPEHGLDTVAWVGTPVPKGHAHAAAILDAFQDICIAHGGKVHWGKMNNRAEARPELRPQWFPKLAAWKQQMRKFNPNDTFSNAFTDRFGLTS